MSVRKVLGTLALVAGFAGCDQSKAELDSTKQQLTAVTTERDALKSQIDAAKMQATTCQTQLDAMKAAQAAPPPAPAPAPEPAKETHKAAKAEPAKPAVKEAPAAVKQDMVQKRKKAGF